MEKKMKEFEEFEEIICPHCGTINPAEDTGRGGIKTLPCIKCEGEIPPDGRLYLPYRGFIHGGTCEVRAQMTVLHQLQEGCKGEEASFLLVSDTPTKRGEFFIHLCARCAEWMKSEKTRTGGKFSPGRVFPFFRRENFTADRNSVE